MKSYFNVVFIGIVVNSVYLFLFQ